MAHTTNIGAERAIRFLTRYLSVSDEKTRKPGLFHAIRVGTMLYNNGYSQNVVVAGFLHYTLEWTSVTKELLTEEFGIEVCKLVEANTKDDSISDVREKVADLMHRCIVAGPDATVIKAADTLDSLCWYAAVENDEELAGAKRRGRALIEVMDTVPKNKIFKDLTHLI